VDDGITNEVLPRVVPPSITVPLTYPVSLHDLNYPPNLTDNFAANPDNTPFGSTEVSSELEVAEKYSHKLFSRQEQSKAKLLSLFSSAGCRLSLFDEVLVHMKKMLN
jgi:hypothetical protein